MANRVGVDLNGIRVQSRDIAPDGNAMIFLSWGDGEQAACEVDKAFNVHALQPLGKTHFQVVREEPASRINVTAAEEACAGEAAKRLGLPMSAFRVRGYDGLSEGTGVRLRTTDGRKVSCFVDTANVVRHVWL